ncbi:MAG: sigma-54 dependent transcriptional regulator [Neomegalonema sp.]|nr:sigma-54 dependent transcriptional regulator [Neomegalonema sp.]
MSAVLIVDDEPDIRVALSQTLELADLDARVAADAEAAAKTLFSAGEGEIGVILCDVKMPGRDGFDLLAEVMAADPDLPVVMLTGHGDVEMAVAAMRAGAYDFLEKPVAGQRLVQVLERALEKRRLVVENRRLRASLQDDASRGGRSMIGDSPAMEQFRSALARIAAADVDLLLHGETGAGKELAARAAHDASPRRGGRFVAINCGALPGELAESELFGHEPGAFTGASRKRVGKFVYADGGAIFLDEIESMPMSLQVALLRVLQEREVEPLGANRTHKIDVRVIAATKVDLREAASAGRFREDLYYRLEVARLDIPPLRDRIEDAPQLFEAFVAEACARRGVEPQPLSDDLREWLMMQSWPGNVRELKNAAERFAIGLPFTPPAQREPVSEVSLEGASLAAQVEAYERRVIRSALKQAGGRVSAACVLLGLPRNTLYDKLKKYGLGR